MLLLRKSVVVILTILFLPAAFVLLVIRYTLNVLSVLFEVIADKLNSIDKQLGDSYDKFCKWMKVK